MQESGATERVTAAPDDFRNLADAIPQLAWMADAAGSIFWYNRRWYDYTGLIPEDMEAQGWEVAHHPDHLARVVAGYRRAIAAGAEWEDTFPLRRHDGLYRWFLSRALPVRSPDGQVMRWYGTNTDITDQRQAEDRLRVSERRFRTLIDSAVDIIWVAAPDGEWTAPQPAWLAFTGQGGNEYRGWGWIDAVHPEDRGRVADSWATAVEKREGCLVEYRLRRRDGAYRHVAVRAVPVADDDGHLREWVGVTTDINDRKLAEQALDQAREAAEQANRAKSQFIANMSHELRTPLSAVIGYSEMLGEELADLGQENLIADVGKIEASARHLLSLINDVLDISKIEAGRMTVSPVDFDVRAMLDDVVAGVGSLIGRKDNELVLDLAPDLGAMRSDEVKIRQCLLNLLSNAAKFTEQGTITLRARRSPGPTGEMLQFEVSDTGIGLTEEQRGRLFERFAQADETTTRQFGGTGLGLAITRAFCLKLAGDVTVSSRIGEGSTFTIVLPADGLIEETDGDEREPTANERDVAGQVILVVDDDASARDLMTRFLQRQGFQVRSATDGKSGLSLARALRPQAVLLDVEMPRMDGWSVLQAIRADPSIAGIPVIMVSVIADQSLGYSLGATDYVTKPVEWNRLRTVMERVQRGTAGNVLIVDEDADARERLTSILIRHGWGVREAQNGQEALERLDEEMPDLILLDLLMPVMDGFTFLDRLRRRPDGQAVPVVVLSAKDVSGPEREVLEHQADRIILKGTMRLAELAQALRHVTRGGAGEPESRGDDRNAHSTR